MKPLESLVKLATDAVAAEVTTLAAVLVIDVTCGPYRLAYRGAPASLEDGVPPAPDLALPPPPREARPDWLFFSPTEALILKAMKDTWQTRDELARATGILQGLASRNDYQAILRNLCERLVLESGPQGFRLRAPNPTR
jgi:hypothetical protein